MLPVLTHPPFLLGDDLASYFTEIIDVFCMDSHCLWEMDEQFYTAALCLWGLIEPLINQDSNSCIGPSFRKWPSLK